MKIMPVMAGNNTPAKRKQPAFEAVIVPKEVNPSLRRLLNAFYIRQGKDLYLTFEEATTLEKLAKNSPARKVYINELRKKAVAYTTETLERLNTRLIALVEGHERAVRLEADDR
ncbi:MAG: hypothetical protein PHC64_09425 [Candidatus Gastranaerophilales bacterium]|nr:hypothetical protein [Candidatus Gastranaerophilales bacterium]